jgi:hypothetical protein
VTTGPADVSSTKESAAAIVDCHLDDLVTLCHAVHATPSSASRKRQRHGRWPQTCA